MNDPRDFTQIELIGEELNIFVIGPGYGEVIVIDLPGPGWLVIDGAGRTESRDFPAHALLEHHLGDDFISAMVLTHPHGDHYRGMRELIDHETLGPKLRRVGCVTKLVDDHTDSMAPSVRSETGAARALLERINSWWAAKPEGRLPLEAGPIQLECQQVELSTLTPTRQTIDGFLDHGGRRERIRRRANELSVVFELKFGEGRYLFTGDLPEPQWEPLLGHESTLHDHDLLKLPHHGSENAQPEALLSNPMAKPRTWVLTPFSRGGKDSRPPTQSGLASLLKYESAVHVTAFPTAWHHTRPAPAEVEFDSLTSAPVRLRDGPSPQGRRLTSRTVDPHLHMGDCYWLFSFDARGHLTRSQRGIAATVVRRSRQP